MFGVRLVPPELPREGGCSALGARTRWVILIALIVAPFVPSLVNSMLYAADPMHINDDAMQQVWPFYGEFRTGPAAGDAIGRYYRSCTPLGYRLLYTVGDNIVGADRLSKVLPFLLLVVVLTGITLSAWGLAGPLAGGLALFTALSASVYMARMSGGLPRAFAYPIIATGCTCLVFRRPRALAATVFVGACFYPVSGLICGVCLALSALLHIVRNRKREDSRVRQLVILVALTVLLCVAVLVPVRLATREFGPLVNIRDTLNYPEWGPNGRYLPHDSPPFSGFVERVEKYAGAAFVGAGPSWASLIGGPKLQLARIPRAVVIVLLLWALVGLLVAIRREPVMHFLLLPVVAVCGFFISRPLAPLLYLPGRYIIYVFPITAAVGVPTGLVLLGRELASRLKCSPLVTAIPAVALLLISVAFMGTYRQNPYHGLPVDARWTQPLYDFIGNLPGNAVIADWPQGYGEGVPYFCRRSALITMETYQTFHEKYTHMVRDRLESVIEAYLAGNPAPLVLLRDKFGVTHLLVCPSDYKTAPAIFQPFSEFAVQRYIRGKAAGWECVRQIEHASVFEDSGTHVLDLSLLNTGVPRPQEPK
ncbi:hypothetical protein ACFLQU_02275 [Verrucomicrobiota bacterium]